MVQQYASHNEDNGRNVYRLGTFGTVLPVAAGMAKSADFRRNVQPFGKQLAHCGKLLGIFRHCHRLSLGQKKPVKLAGGGKLTKTSGKGLHTNSKLLFAKVFFKTQLRFAVATATKTLSTKNAPEQRVRFCVFAICCKFVSLLFEAFAQPYNDICFSVSEPTLRRFSRFKGKTAVLKVRLCLLFKGSVFCFFA